MVASKPIKPYIYFAGEHTDLDYFGSTHGAYMSGQTVVDEIIESMLPENSIVNNNTKDRLKDNHVYAPGAVVTKASSAVNLHKSQCICCVLLILYILKSVL